MTSPATLDYNCVAWAAEDTDNWWWPSEDPEDASWPEDAPREATADAFAAAFASKGYQPCDSPDLEPGWEKIAVFALNGELTHAARQLRDGTWTSKLGRFEDISHSTPDAVSDRTYGHVELILRRPRAGASERQRRQRARQRADS